MYFLGITTNKLCKEFVWWTKTYSNGIQYHRVRGLKKTERKNYGSHPQIMEDNTVYMTRGTANHTNSTATDMFTGTTSCTKIS